MQSVDLAADRPEFLITREHSNKSKTGQVSYALLCYWIVAFAHYAFRYILQVSDNRISPNYSDTPAYLSAIKGVLLACLIVSALFHRHQAQIPHRYRTFWVTSLVLLLISGILAGLRILAGQPIFEVLVFDLWYTWLYLALVLLIPYLCNPESIEPTLRRFASLAFWIAFPFWAVTVFLYYSEGRLPNNSFPGVPRFGGIIDDPNGYGALLVLLVALSIAFRGRLWRFRLMCCTMMLIGTQSLSGAIIGISFLLIVVGRQLFRRFTGNNIIKVVAILCSIVIVTIIVFTIGDGKEYLANQLEHFWKYKQESARIHFDDLRFPPGFFELGLFEALVGKAGLHSENFYWSVLLNEGAVGFLLMTFAIATALRQSSKSSSQWSSLVVMWAVSVLFASMGIPYLRVFPTNMLFWSFLAACVYAPRRAYRTHPNLSPPQLHAPYDEGVISNTTQTKPAFTGR